MKFETNSFMIYLILANLLVPLFMRIDHINYIFTLISLTLSN
jgi:hypothetical protein